jgi:hypothetical protein
MNGPALGVPAPGDQACLLEHLNVLGHRLLRDVERLGQFVDRRRTPRQARHDRPTNRIGQRQEGPVESVRIAITPQSSTFSLINQLIDYNGRGGSPTVSRVSSDVPAGGL